MYHMYLIDFTFQGNMFGTEGSNLGGPEVHTVHLYSTVQYTCTVVQLFSAQKPVSLLLRFNFFFISFFVYFLFQFFLLFFFIDLASYDIITILHQCTSLYVRSDPYSGTVAICVTPCHQYRVYRNLVKLGQTKVCRRFFFF